jgi:LysM repeat protein
VYAGQVLRVTSPTNASAAVTTPSGYYSVRAGDTLISIASQFRVDPLTLADVNNIPDNGFIYVGWKLKIPKATQASAPTNQAYIVQAGDSLTDIALQYNTTAQAIVIVNNLRTDWLIVPGQRLAIPAGKPAPSSDSSSPETAVIAKNPALNIRLGNFPLYRQQQTLTCEEAAARMALRGALTEAKIVEAMPRDENPFLGIRGRTNSAILGGLTDYGTYAHGLQRGLAALGFKSTVLYNAPYANFKEALIANLRAGKPVIWWNTWRDTFQKPVWVKTSTGNFVKLVPYEHTVLVVGATDRGVTYNDPYDGTIRTITWATHQRVSSYFDNMALVMQ